MFLNRVAGMLINRGYLHYNKFYISYFSKNIQFFQHSCFEIRFYCLLLLCNQDAKEEKLDSKNRNTC